VKKTASISLFATAAVILLAVSLYVAVNYGQIEYIDAWGATIIAHDLPEKTQSYFAFENPDPYVLEAISNPGKPIYIHYFNYTQIDEMIESYGTSNIEYNYHCYNVDLVYTDSIAVGDFIPILIAAAWLLFGLSAIIVAVRVHSKKQIPTKS